MKKPPRYALMILERLESAGFTAFLVGGGVRDLILERRPKDWDAATSARPEEIAKLFRAHKMTGADYGTVTVRCGGRACEVTTYRIDGEYLDGRRPASVTFTDDIHDDLRRRDLTANAIALGKRGELVDPFGGADDIENKLLRAVGDPRVRFTEDALRMLRCVRLSAELGFEIEENTREAIRDCAELVRNVSDERYSIELERILMSPRPEKVSELIELGLAERYALSDADYGKIRKLRKDRRLRFLAFAELSQRGTEVLKELKLPKKIWK